MAGIGIILNPHSRSNRKNPERITRLGFIVGDKGACKATHDVMDIPTIVREFKQRGIEILGISGGDGTNHCTLTTFIEEYGDTPLPKIAFLRGGTMNAIANALDIHGSPEQILSNLILKYHEDQPFETKEVELLNINGKYGFLFGNGLVSRFIELYYRNKGGPASAFWLLVRVAAGVLTHSRISQELCERFDAEVVADGRKWGFRNYVFLNAGTVEDFCFGFKPLYLARSRPGHFQVMGCTASPLAVLGSFPSILLKRPLPRKYFEDSVVREALIRLDKPQSYMIDGDIQPAASEISIKTGPRITVIIK